MESCGSNNQGNNGRENFKRCADKRPADRGQESFDDKVMADAKALIDEIVAQIAEDGEGKSEREVRALIEEQLAIKGKSYHTVHAMMSQWDSEKFWKAVNYSKSGREDRP